MSYFGFSNYVSPPKSPVEGRTSPIRSPIIPFKTSPSQLNEVSTCPDFTFSNSLRSPEGPMRGRSVKEFEETLAALRKENFNLKIRIYFLEERMGANFNLDKENILKKNVELMVEIESLKKELQEKHDLLCQAVKAMDLEEDEFKKTAQAKNEEIMILKQEVDELKQQLQDGNDNDSSHKSYHSEPLFFSSKIGSITESSSKIRILQERITTLENELEQEKENSASLQMIVDQADVIQSKYDVLHAESIKKEETINSLRKELTCTKESFAKLSSQMADLEKTKDDFKLESQKLSRLLLEKSQAVDESEEHIAEMKRKYCNLKTEYERERQKGERAKFVSDMKVTELEEDLERQKGRVQDLQKKLGATGQELKENQNLLVPNGRTSRSTSTNTDCDNVSVQNSAASPGVSKEDALRDALGAKSPSSKSPSSKSPVAPKTFDFDLIYRILNPLTFKTKPQLLKQLGELKEALSTSEQKIVRLKAQELKACALLKNLMQYHKTAEEQNRNHKIRIMELEKELEGVVSKPEAARSSGKNQEKVDSSKEENEFKELVQELENKLQILELTLKEKNIHIQYIEARNTELQNNVQDKEKDLIDLECSMSSQTSGRENCREISEKTYSKLFEEKNKEIEKLNEELRKRTQDLQGVVNQELWQKNKEIEKLQIKYTQLLENKEKEMVELKESFSTLSNNLCELRNENEEKHNENTNLKIDISDLRLQLQLLREKIGEIGLISDDKLEVEIIISSLDEMKNIQQQLEDLKQEKEMLTKKINELEGAVLIYEGSPQETETLKDNLRISEALRMQTTEVCHILRRQLEELAVFLDSLMKQKSVLGFLGSTQNRKLREAVEHSLDLSKSLNLSLSMNPEQSLMQLSNITSLLNCSGVSNMNTTDNNRYSFSLMPEQATLTYQSHLFRVDDENQEGKSFTVKALEDQIQILQKELSMKNSELNRYRRESRNGKELRSSHSKPRISPNKLKTSITVRSELHDSESEVWSEPDVNVSKARIGLFKEDHKVVGIEEIPSSDSTDESLTQLDLKKSDILNECQVTITKLSRQVQDLQAKLQEKESYFIELQEANESANTLKETNNLLLVRVETLENQLKEAKYELEQVKECRREVEKELESLKEQIQQLEISKNELVDSHNRKDKELSDKINKMKVEREQLVNMASEYASMTETSRQEIIDLENKLTQLSIEKENLSIEKENIEVNLKKEYDEKLMIEVKNAEKQLTDKLRETEMKAVEQVQEMTKKITELTENYAENYVKKSEILEKMKKIEDLNLEVEVLKENLKDRKRSAELSESVEKSIKEEINNLQIKVNEVESEIVEATKEKKELNKALDEENRKNAQLQKNYKDIQQELWILKETYDKEVTMLHGFKTKLELKVSELEFNNADLHNRLVKLQSEMNEQCQSTTSPGIDNRSVPIHQVSPYSRQISNSSQLSQCYISEDEVKTRGIFSVVVPQKSLDCERIESNASPDLGIESDQGRFSSLEVQAQASRPLQQTIEIAESMNNLLDGDNNSIQGSTCDNKSCYQKSVELSQENNNLKKKLLKTRKALEDTVTQLTLANQRKKLVEKNICRQIHKTSQVLREAKANLDSGSETDFHKK